MPFRKEGADKLIPKGIEDKYEVIRILQETAATAVLLVNYKSIGALRILKAIHKASPNAHSILSEAHLLQGIKSSRIPTIYSVEDTIDMYYLVEEFIEGISLREYLLETKLSKEELFRLAYDICHIFEALHTAEPEPVLYRDLKPEHLILQGDKLRLIDFGIAIRRSQSAMAMPLGTKNWAAPEQLLGQALDERCDIYSVGKVIEYLQINSYAKDDFRLRKLVDKATAANPDDRYSSITELKAQLQKLQGVRANENTESGILDRKIAVIGADCGVGTTHIAINLCRFLNSKHIETYYKDFEKNTVHRLWENFKDSHVRSGVLYHKNFRGILNYGEAVEKYTPPSGLYVLDCGTNDKYISDAKIIFYVVSASPWKTIKYPAWIKDKTVYVISNFSNKLFSLKLAKDLHKKVFMYPSIKWSLNLSKEEERFFSTVLKNEKDITV